MSRKRDISHVSEFDATQLPPAPAHRVPVPPSPYQLPGQQLAPSSLLDAANSLEQQQQYRPPSSSASGSGLDLGEQRQMQNFAAAAIQANSNRAGGAGGPAAGPSSSGANANAAGGAAGGASEFVKKLFNILEDREYDDVVSWGAQGDSFVVKDMNAFTTVILPQHFKHSNFASFVRQLNKYDFHKVKYPDEQPSPYGEQAWEFRHPHFKSDMKDALDNIRRKGPQQKKAAGANVRASSVGAGQSPNPFVDGAVVQMQAQLDTLSRSYASLDQHVAGMTRDYGIVVNEIVHFQRNLVAQDQLMQNIIQYLFNLEAELKMYQPGAGSGSAAPVGLVPGAPPGPPSPTSQAQPLPPVGAAATAPQDNSVVASGSGPAVKGFSPSPSTFVPSLQAQRLISSYTEAARVSHDQLADLSRRASLPGSMLPEVPMPPPTFGQLGFEINGLEIRAGTDFSTPSVPPPDHSLLARHHPPPPPPPPPQQQQQQQGPSKRQPALLPGWTVPPRVLLVEDDAVTRKLASRFLKYFGCEIESANDGVDAVNKMNAGKRYDLVLMDIMMPNMDGVSATSVIRQFDPNTPIVSMTGNANPNDVMMYLSHGMNDILPKPFTKEGLLDMLEKHLAPLKVMAQVAEIPRALGFSEGQISDALQGSVVRDETDSVGSAASGSGGGGGGGPNGRVSSAQGTRMAELQQQQQQQHHAHPAGPGGMPHHSSLNPLSSVGISDQDYLNVLQQFAIERDNGMSAGHVPTQLEVVRSSASMPRFELMTNGSSRGNSAQPSKID